MKKAILIAASLILIASGMAYARIGETLDQCTQRYGEPVTSDPENQTWGFSKSGIVIVAHFFGGKVDMISFAKSERDILNTALELSQNEIDILLASNSQGHKWKKQAAPSLDSDWQTDDGKMLAHYTYSGHILMVATNDWMDRQIDSKASAEKEKLNSF